MPTVEERLASLEARMDRMDDLHNLIAAMRDDVKNQFTESRADTNRQFDATNSQFADLRADMNRQFDATNGQLTDLRSDMNRQFIEVRMDMTRRFELVEHRFQGFDLKVDRHFTWVIGIQVTLMLAVLGAMVGTFYR